MKNKAKDRFNLYKFSRPTILKLVLLAVLVVFSPFLAILNIRLSYIWLINPFFLYAATTFTGYPAPPFLQTLLFYVLAVLSIIFWYFVSCIIVWVYAKVKISLVARK